ncbi:sensor histidine kinase [Maricaulis sp.]|uniref:sensor histidine kinase n=1 Tax=Maricaulis sp. TaxID=1486257 RepID=UPI003A8ED5ED
MKMTFEALTAPIRRLDPRLQVRLWGVAVILALSLTDALGAISATNAGLRGVSPSFLAHMIVYSLGSLAVCQLILTPFLREGVAPVWLWLAALAGALANAGVEILSYWTVLYPELEATGARLWNGYLFSVLATGGPRVALWLAVMLVLLHAMKRQREQERVRDLEAAFANARLSHLENQINPHFLFNALNTISALVALERKSDAVGAVASLGELLRRSLKHSASPLASVADEIESTELYLHVEALRFPDRLMVVWKIPDRFLSVAIPRFTLQPLLENVVKHSVARSVDLVTATIEITELPGSRCCITVRNDGYVPAGPEASAEMADDGIGLANLKQRTKILFPEAGEVRCGPLGDNQFECRLIIPISQAEPAPSPEDKG